MIEIVFAEMIANAVNLKYKKMKIINKINVLDANVCVHAGLDVYVVQTALAVQIKVDRVVFVAKENANADTIAHVALIANAAPNF